ncbi:MAG TPA: (d)CMP kinase [bacterium]|nr:(d)CMP kinase [bacterium]HOL47735.1 (d)CMP kinase [bacterium]HPQ18031.1 (d)CMP kinase [bacterium]
MKIAIDGPAGAGKSTVAKILAEKLNFIYIDTGAMYRAVTYVLLKKNIPFTNLEKIKEELDKIEIKLIIEKNNKKIICNNEDVTEKIREPIISNNVSEVSAIKIVREKLVQLQRELAKNNNVIMDGRDIGTVVLPDSEYKFYLDASAEERAKRRYKELLEKRKDINYNEISASINERDKKDSTRNLSPLKKADDAIYIDTTNLTINEVVEEILSYVKK